MVEMVEVRVGSGFMLSRTEVLARLMVGPAIRHWRAVPNASPAHQAQRDHSRFKAGAYAMPSPASSDVCCIFSDGGVGRSEMKKDRRRFGFRGKARLSDCVSEGSVEGLRRESAVGRRVERLSQGSALSGTKARAGKRSGSLLSCV